MIRKKILAVSALVSLIPLASVSIVSCKKKEKTETNKDEQQKPSTPDTPGSPSAPSTPDIQDPSQDENQNSGTGGDLGNGNQGSSTEGVMTVTQSKLSFTQSETGKWWMNVWIWGSNLSNNIDHYKFSSKEGNIEIPNSYWKVQHIDEYGYYGYFTQKLLHDESNNELFAWLKKQYNNKKYDAVVVQPVRNDIKPSNVQKPPTPTDKTPKIHNFYLQRTFYDSNEPERSIVVSGEYLPTNFSSYELIWKNIEDGTTVIIPQNLFSEKSKYGEGNYALFRLKSNIDQKFKDEFDKIYWEQRNGKTTFELKLKQS